MAQNFGCLNQGSLRDSAGLTDSTSRFPLDTGSRVSIHFNAARRFVPFQVFSF